MATGNNHNAAFYSISNGKICRQFATPTANSVSRLNMNGKTVNEEFYDYIDGVIVDIATRESGYGKEWNITLDDNGQKQMLQMNYSGGYAAAFLKTLPNVNLDLKVKLTPKLTIEGDKKRTTLFVNQHGVALKHFYTKDAPNGLPRLKEVKVKGKTAWDDSDMMEFLESMINTSIKPKLGKVAAVAQPEQNEEVEDDGMPF